MKSISIYAPQKIKIIKVRKKYCDISLAENIVKSNGKYTYDSYIITMPYTPTIVQTLEKNYAQWIKYARDHSDNCYTDIQLLQQQITDLDLENIRLGQKITEYELEILEG